MLPSTTLAVMCSFLSLMGSIHACCLIAYPASKECAGMPGCYAKYSDFENAGGACCGNGPCNIFCCNCDNGCRGSRRRDVFDVEEKPLTDEDAFGLADVQGKGEITLEEYLKYMGRTEDQTEVLKEWFKEHDFDGNGVITVNETRKVR